MSSSTGWAAAHYAVCRDLDLAHRALPPVSGFVILAAGGTSVSVFVLLGLAHIGRVPCLRTILACPRSVLVRDALFQCGGGVGQYLLGQVRVVHCPGHGDRADEGTDFTRIAAEDTTAAHVVARMVELYPDWENLRTLWHSARTAIARQGSWITNALASIHEAGWPARRALAAVETGT